jgi:hypothetical protein
MFRTRIDQDHRDRVDHLIGDELIAFGTSVGNTLDERIAFAPQPASWIVDCGGASPRKADLLQSDSKTGAAQPSYSDFGIAWRMTFASAIQLLQARIASLGSKLEGNAKNDRADLIVCMFTSAAETLRAVASR